MDILHVMLAFVLGYAVGGIDSIKKSFKHHPVQSDRAVEEDASFFATAKREEKIGVKKKITIDESKFVTDVSTEDMKSVSTNALGVVTQSNDDISSATNKLAQLKKMKG